MPVIPYHWVSGQATSTEKRGVMGLIPGWLSLQDMSPAGKKLRAPDAIELPHLTRLSCVPRQRLHQALSLSSYETFIMLRPWASAYQKGFLLLVFASLC